MKKLIYTLALTLALSTSLVAQSVGSLNTAFDSDGFWSKDILNNGDADAALATLVQPDGKVLLAGYAYDGVSESCLITRLNPDGSLDPNFNGTGSVMYDLGAGETDALFAIALQPDGKIIGVGTIDNGTDNDLLVIRLNPDGSKDNSFGTNGVGTYDFSLGGDEVGYDVALQSDGKIVIAGTKTTSGNSDAMFARIHVDGTPDYSFDSDGRTFIDASIGGDEELLSVSIGADGDIIGAGYGDKNASKDGLIIKLFTDGSRDTLFGSNGIWYGDFSNNNADYLYDVELLDDNKVVACGYFNNGTDYDAVVIRLHYDGVYDYSFSSNGRAEFDYALGDDDLMHELRVQDDGKILVVGNSIQLGLAEVTITRLHSDGQMDYSFAGNGYNVTSMGQTMFIQDMSISDDGIVYACGSVDGDCAAISFTSDPLTGVENALQPAGSLRSFPNPCTDRLTVRIEGTGTQGYILADMTGRVLATGSLSEGDNDLSEVIRPLAAGTYLLRLDGGSVPQSTRITKY